MWPTVEMERIRCTRPITPQTVVRHLEMARSVAALIGWDWNDALGLSHEGKINHLYRFCSGVLRCLLDLAQKNIPSLSNL